MGHIELAARVCHIWYLKGVPSRTGLMLDMSPRALERVVYFASYVVTDPGHVKGLLKKQLLTEAEYRELREKHGNGFKAGIGAEAIKELLGETSPDAATKKLRTELKTASGQKRMKILKRLEVVEAFRKSGNKPDWMILDVIPVIPPDLRPMVQLDGGRFATSDLNDLYRRVINRNNRLKRLLDLGAPETIVNNETRMLQEAVDAPCDNGRRGRPLPRPGLRPAPTLHRLGIQAFEPVLVEGKAIQIHPLVCAAFNADFDGDQMAVHLPLSAEAQAEARILMLSANNILSPAHGRPIAIPTQDMVIGAYYLTEMVDGAPGEGRYFSSLSEAEMAFDRTSYDPEASPLSIHAKIRVRMPASKFPEDRFPERSDAVRTPPDKAQILDGFEREAEKVETQFRKGVITDDERRQKEIEIWTEATDKVREAMQRSMAAEKFNPIDMMVGSGARGNIMQVRQIAGMRGLVANPRGEIIPRPIKSNFREGLSVLEYFISTHGARKGLADTALRTADSGYLTRRLVDVAQELIVRDEDCESNRGIWGEAGKK